MVMQEGSGFVCWHKNQSDDAKMYADYVEACTNVRVAFHNRNGLSLVKLSEHEESAVAAHLHEQRMHSKRARKLWFVAADETASHWQFGWTVTTATSKVPSPDARIPDWMVAMLTSGQQKYALRVSAQSAT
jgi:hypothetical protein